MIPSAFPAGAPQRTTVDVCICTFRRASLRNTLASIALQRLPSGVAVRIVVADNDVSPNLRDAVVADGRALGLDLTYLHAPFANIAVARNACLDAAGAAWIAFIDDDETAAPDWLARLLEAGDGMDVVFGVSQALYSDPAIPKWIREGDFHSNRIDGNEASWNGYTANVLIRRDVVCRHALRFDPAFGQTGGEDTRFFLQLHCCGGRFAYCPEAIVYEETPAERATLRWLLRRRYRAGQVHQRLHSDSVSVPALAGMKAAALLAASVFARSRVVSARRLLRGALHVGVLGAGVGLAHFREYARPSGGCDARNGDNGTETGSR